ncbi:hypothetical protein G5714_019017 [Onychostoma macrolepis]|uniref:Uncharacterized protein n=1 Tax=Onychostoma macrolepis TaxID=369639 RepID=A0A7J6C185_9TELE|nr:hypothetical protein G5714_019017 [Onychostoma macrolepis]
MHRMESVVRKSNKENTKPECRPKKQVISGIASNQKVICRSAPLQSKNDLKEDKSGTREKEKDVRPKTKTNADPTKSNTLTQAFSTQQTVRHRNLVKEVQKPPSSVSAIQKSKLGRSAISKPIASKKKEKTVQVEKPKTTTTEQKVCRPVASTVSQYKVQIKTAEERRAKFAEWKGKTLKRPPILEKSATFSRNPKPAPRPKTGPKATIAQSEPVVQSEAVKPTPALKTDDQTNDIEVPDNKTVCSRRSSNIMNTTLDLQNNSDMDLPVDSEIRMESLVLNLCDKLDAMEMPSSCEDGVNVDKSDVEAEKRIEVQVKEQETDKVFEILGDEEDTESDITEDTKKAVIKNEDDSQELKEMQPFVSEDEEHHSKDGRGIHCEIQCENYSIFAKSEKDN